MPRTGPAPTTAPVLGGPVVVDLMNTVWADRDGVYDALATGQEVRGWIAAVRDRLPVEAAGLDAWLRSAGPSGLEDLGSRLRDLRDGARRLAAEETADPRPTAQSPVAGRGEAVGIVNALAAEAPTWASLSWSRGRAPRRETHHAAPAGTALVAGLASLAVELFGGDLRTQLRACLAPGCVLYFVKDHPRREWCSSACGNRARVARHYRRHHG